MVFFPRKLSKNQFCQTLSVLAISTLHFVTLRGLNEASAGLLTFLSNVCLVIALHILLQLSIRHLSRFNLNAKGTGSRGKETSSQPL